MNDDYLKDRVASQVRRSYGNLTIDDLYEAFIYFDKKCPYTGEVIESIKDWHLEHIVPV